ncbi:MAG: Ig-like domain-containing protein [Lachnospiraceae bacterium]|nr:Ig-like domain-containing protein [Lachnospiraceae bacterium]
MCIIDSVTTTPEGGSITWTSDNTGILTIDNNGVMTGVSEGTAVITGTCGDAKATWQVKVTRNYTGDTVTKLKDKDGNQIYVKNSEGKYVEAVYADYYKDQMLYLRKANAECFYTGWQTIDGYTYFYDKNGNYVTGEQIIQGAKYSFDSQGRMSNNSGTLGIDVSKWNGSIDWNAVKNSGVSYVIIRCGYRGSSTGALIEDPKFVSNIKGAKAAGLKVGVYFFSQAVNEVEAVEEASMALNLVSGYGLEYPIFLDVEASNGRGDKIDVATRTAVCKAFCATIQNSGYTAGVYANTTWFTTKINAGSLTGYKIWLAQYASAPTYTATKYDMWQYTSKGSVSGISGSVDMNISYLNY